MFSFVPIRLGHKKFSQTILEAYSPDSLGWRFMESDWLQNVANIAIEYINDHIL